MLLTKGFQSPVLEALGGAVTLPASSFHQPATALHGQAMKRQSPCHSLPTVFHTRILLFAKYVLAFHVLRCSCVRTCVAAKYSSYLPWRLEHGCCDCFNLVNRNNAAQQLHCCIDAGMWLGTRNQVKEYIASPLWNKTKALAVDIHDNLDIAYGLDYPGTWISASCIYNYRASLSAMHGMGMERAPFHCACKCHMPLGAAGTTCASLA